MGVLHAQNKVITGKVTDENNNPLQGVTIVVKGATTGVATNTLGDFSITVPAATNILTVSYVGFETIDVSIRNKTSVSIGLHSSASKLSEVVVVGYGTQKRKDVTGSVSSVKGDLIKNQPATNLTEALQGRAAGVEIIKSSGAPDATPSIIIRGLSSLNQPQPLYIVDGVRVPGDNINIQDIATVDILKDASSAAIYGSAAAGGVIVITTKKGAGTKPAINFNARYGVTKPRLIKLLDKTGYINLENILNPQYFSTAQHTDTLANTDWVSQLYGNATEENYNLSVGGSSPVANYLFSGFYNKQKGIYKNNSSAIIGARINTDYKLSDRIKIGEQISLSQRQTSPPVGTEAQLHNAPFRTLPIIPIYGKNGGYGVLPAGYGMQFGGPNPVGALNSASAQNFKNNLQGNVYAEVKLPLYLTFRTNFGYSYYHESQDYYQSTFNFGAVVNNTNSLNKYSIESTQLLSNYVLSFDHSFGKHNINALAGYEQITGKYNNINVTESSVGLSNYSFVQTSQTSFSVYGKYDPNLLIKSYFGRVNYNYNGLYYISGSLRQDANFTVFGPNKQKGVFPAASAGWNISNEQFFKRFLTTINTLKLRGSYGQLGNSNIGSYSYVASYNQFAGGGGRSIGAQNFAPGGPLVIANSINAIPNPDLHWETVNETNIGLDGEALKSKLYFSVDWYKKTTKDMLFGLPLPLSSGFTAAYQTNIGSVDSKGLDILVGYRNKAGNLGYDVSVTAGFNKNKVLDLNGTGTGVIYDGYNYYSIGDAAFNIMSNQAATITKAGLPFGSFYGYKAIGMFQTDAQAAASASPMHMLAI
ncbi:MAG: SusC/RagA family TonB-linked outer membrane protein [Ferruginibacter sp.]